MGFNTKNVSIASVIVIFLIFQNFTNISYLPEQVSEVELFNRCYSHLTQFQYPYDEQLNDNLTSSPGSALDRCHELLGQTSFVNHRLLASVPDDSKKILNNFHKLHSSWFVNKSFPNIGNPIAFAGARDMHDPTSPALFLTKAMFDPDFKVKDILTGYVALKAIRSGGEPTIGPYTLRAKSAYQSGNEMIYHEVGHLLGVKPVSQEAIVSSVQYNQSFGGGVIGSAAYVLKNLDEPMQFVSDGAVKTPRKWARSVFKDFLCRDMPAVRFEDATAYVSTHVKSPSFRKSKACTQCHTSLDPMSYTLRNVKLGMFPLKGVTVTRRGFHYPEKYPASITDNNHDWLEVANKNFHKMSPKGQLIFRDYQGRLKKIPVSNLNNLGEKLSELDDFYICLTQKYYNYFTGINIPLGDGGKRTVDYLSLTDFDLEHRQIIIDLALDLKSHQSLKKLISNIIDLPHYSQSDYGAGSFVNE